MPNMIFGLILVLISFRAISQIPDWSDEFELSGAPDSNKWGYEIGLIRNEELQSYEIDAVAVSQGVMRITATRDQVLNPAFHNRGGGWKNRQYSDYRSGSVHTHNRISFLYGRLDVRAKLPVGGGVWPAIWMLGENIDKVGYPACGEIDILEYLGRRPGWVQANVHYPSSSRKSSFLGKKKLSNLENEFHVFSVIRSSSFISFEIDGLEYHRFEVAKADYMGDNPFRKPMYLLINLAIGSQGGIVDWEEGGSRRFEVDYVRFFKSE